MITTLGTSKAKNICFDAGESIKYVHTLFCFAMISIKKLVRTLSTFGTKIDENSGTTSEG